MATEQVTPEQLVPRLKARQMSIRKALLTGAERGARGGRAVLVIRSPKDRGQFKAAWRSTSFSRKTGEIARVSNDAPYAGIIEHGARPHPVSKEGQRAIMTWVMRHFRGQLGSGQEMLKSVRSITWAIVQKIKREGQKPTFFVRNSLPDLQRLVALETDRALKTQAGKRGG